jgi:hypothetical protein
VPAIGFGTRASLDDRLMSGKMSCRDGEPLSFQAMLKP